jgi:putative (di)nucleoside polyphosphate hydrolase
MPDLSLYRPNVGVVLFNRGRARSGTAVVTRREGPTTGSSRKAASTRARTSRAAALRELQEETGVTSADLMGGQGGFSTTSPPGLMAQHVREKRKPWNGQRQTWFAFRFTGEESEIDLNQHEEVEFDAWRWGDCRRPAT